tara:strand:+ start:41 stop:490 length:450 start_codon:yes stop_codon:yes gene_type:complete
MLEIFEKIKKNNLKIDDFNNLDKATLITTLLVECAKSDDNFSETENDLIKRILKNKLHLEDSDIQSCLSKATENSEESVEIYSLTKDIRDNFNKEEILLIFEYLWKIILSDGVVDDFESSMMTKLTGLFHLSGKENAEAKNNAKASLNQ